MAPIVLPSAPRPSPRASRARRSRETAALSETLFFVEMAVSGFSPHLVYVYDFVFVRISQFKLSPRRRHYIGGPALAIGSAGSRPVGAAGLHWGARSRPGGLIRPIGHPLGPKFPQSGAAILAGASRELARPVGRWATRRGAHKLRARWDRARRPIRIPSEPSAASDRRAGELAGAHNHVAAACVRPPARSGSFIEFASHSRPDPRLDGLEIERRRRAACEPPLRRPN